MLSNRCDECGKIVRKDVDRCPWCGADLINRVAPASSVPVEFGDTFRSSVKPLIEKKGHNGILRVYPEFVEIDRKTSRIIGGLFAGLHGVKRIYFKEMGSINFKKTGLAVGWIQFSLLGGRDTSGIMKTVKNENTITFNKDNKDWEKVYHYIQKLLDDFKVQVKNQVGAINKVSITDELEKAGKLFNQGLISKEEYEKLKEKILN